MLLDVEIYKVNNVLVRHFFDVINISQILVDVARGSLAVIGFSLKETVFMIVPCYRCLI